MNFWQIKRCNAKGMEANQEVNLPETQCMYVDASASHNYVVSISNTSTSSNIQQEAT